MSNRAILKLAAVFGVLVMLWMLVRYEPPDSETTRRREMSSNERIRAVTDELVREPLSSRDWRALGVALASHESWRKRTARWVREAPAPIVERAPVEAYAWYWTGWGFDELGEEDAATESWELAREAFAAHVATTPPEEIAFETLWRQGVCHDQLGEEEALLKSFASARELVAARRSSWKPSYAMECMQTLASWYRRTGHPLEMLAVYEDLLDFVEMRDAAVTQVDWSSLLFNSQAAAHAEAARPEARTLYERVERLVWEPALLAALARARGAIGDEELARATWQKAADAQRSRVIEEGFSAPAWLDLCRYRCGAGQREEAIDAWREARAAGYRGLGSALQDPDLQLIQDVIREEDRQRRNLRHEADEGGGAE